ncbi:MAG: hypothetical protein GWN55_16275 [Phycisphaerae bacterium]|nr:hypothetical protein [Phycisphaerae bacterium]NIP54268.1 hypothetical protein [Phycisphaerae bacterium]NIS54595.1 hypothetical protein [Phycisphaerae bacterium]NIV02852.1 hypothetical protein [Phycisphaerae bacterium]NIX00875.1 hypothetical protein [Phycisphaerae bacterium]
MGWVPTAAIIAGGILQAGASIRGGYAAGQAADYNAAMARYEAEHQKKRAAFEEEQHREDVARFLGRQMVAGAAGGGTTTTGSDITPLIETAKAGEVDAAIIRYGGAIESWRAEQASNLYRAQAGEYRTAGWVGAGSSLINTIGQYDWKSKYPTTRKFKPSPLTKKWALKEKFGLR